MSNLALYWLKQTLNASRNKRTFSLLSLSAKRSHPLPYSLPYLYKILFLASIVVFHYILNRDKPIKSKVKETPVLKKSVRLQPLNHNLQGNFPSINLDGNELTQKDIQYPVKNTKILTRIEESLLTNIPKLYKKNEYLMNLLERDSKPQHSKRSVYALIQP